VRRRGSITIPLARTLIMLGLGSGGMVRELFLVERPDLTRMGVCMLLMLGPAVVESWWRARNPTPAVTPLPESSSTPASPSS